MLIDMKIYFSLFNRNTARPRGTLSTWPKNTVYLEMIYLGVQCMYFCAKPLQNQCILELVHCEKESTEVRLFCFLIQLVGIQMPDTVVEKTNQANPIFSTKIRFLNSW